MVKTLKVLKCLRRNALLRVVHSVWSVNQDCLDSVSVLLGQCTSGKKS